MNAETKRRSLREFRSLIQLPLVYCDKDERHIRISYQIHGQYYYAIAVTPLEVAKMLMGIGKIARYSINREGFQMEVKEIRTITGKKGEPIMYEKLLPCSISDIEISREDAIEIAALHYWEIAKVKLMSKPQAKVIKMYETIVRRIA